MTFLITGVSCAVAATTITSWRSWNSNTINSMVSKPAWFLFFLVTILVHTSRPYAYIYCHAMLSCDWNATYMFLFISGTPRLCQLFGMEQRRKVRLSISGKHLINDAFITMTRAELVCILLACESLYWTVWMNFFSLINWESHHI